jgi:hypothetical protein
MVNRIAAAGVVTFVFVAACGAVCQNAGQPLPDAPSARAANETPGFNVFVKQARPPLRFGAMGGHADVMRQAEFAAPDNLFRHKESRTLLEKYLDPSLPKQRSNQPSNEGSLMSRATRAAAGIFVTRDESGNGQLNTSYFVRALASAAADTGSRPYWRRSAGEPFSAFGSTVGNDAGMNLLHEFAPGIQHLVKNHAPRFVARIVTERIKHI